MASAGMNPKALQYLMGHSDISITLNVYTHLRQEDARQELLRVLSSSSSPLQHPRHNCHDLRGNGSVGELDICVVRH